VDDAEEFAEVRRAMELLSFTKQEMDDIFSICAGVLHCGNIAFVQTGDRASKVGAPKALEDAAHLLQVKKDALEQVCVTRRMQVPGQAPITVGLGAEEAKAARDALSKFIYEKLFDVSARPSDGAIRADGYLCAKQPACGWTNDAFLLLSFALLFSFSGSSSASISPSETVVPRHRRGARLAFLVSSAVTMARCPVADAVAVVMT
jgi:hypothetical protein